MKLVEKHAHRVINGIREINEDISELRKELSNKNCKKDEIHESINILENEIDNAITELIADILELGTI